MTAFVTTSICGKQRAALVLTAELLQRVQCFRCSSLTESARSSEAAVVYPHFTVGEAEAQTAVCPGLVTHLLRGSAGVNLSRACLSPEPPLFLPATLSSAGLVWKGILMGVVSEVL